MPTFPDRQPDVSPAAAACLLRAFGARGWTIAHHDTLSYWAADRASEDGCHIRFICAHSPAVLAAKLVAADLAQQ